MSTRTPLLRALRRVPIISTIGVLAGSIMIESDKATCRHDPRPVVSILGLAVVGTGACIASTLLYA